MTRLTTLLSALGLVILFGLVPLPRTTVHAQVDNQCQGTCGDGGGGYNVPGCAASGITFCNAPQASGPGGVAAWRYCYDLQDIAWEGYGVFLIWDLGYDSNLDAEVYMWQAYFPWWFDWSYYNGNGFCQYTSY